MSSSRKRFRENVEWLLRSTRDMTAEQRADVIASYVQHLPQEMAEILYTYYRTTPRG